jgi:putative transposase
VIDTTNAIESVNMTLRKVTRNHRIFPSDEAVYKVVYLAIRNMTKKWTMPIHDWKPALNRLSVEFAERFENFRQGVELTHRAFLSEEQTGKR